jgi:glycosyltransferase involved in cell wall biosynthesis
MPTAAPGPADADRRVRRLLALTPYAVVPPTFGGAVRAYNLCRALGRIYRVDQFAQQVAREHVAARLDPVVQSITPTYTEYSPRDPLSVLLYGLTSIALGSQPIWNSAALGLTAPRWLRQRAAVADIILVFQPWQFEWARRRARPRGVVALDAQNVEAQLFTAERIRGPRRLARALAREIDRQEYRAVRAADIIFTTCEADADALARRCDTPLSRFVVARNGVDCEAYQPVTPQLRERRKHELGLAGRRVVAFAGSRFGPSIEAAELIASWAREWPDDSATFLVVGGVGGALRDAAHPRLRVTGPVEDTRPYLEAADVAVNPVLSGSGTNLKQLEYMALGLPSALTPVGARGLDLKDGVHGLIAPAEAIPERLRALLADPPARAALGAAARRLAEERYDWRLIASAVADACEARLARS